MSTIHNALSQAQKQQDALKGPYPGSGSGAGGPQGSGIKRLILIAGLVVFLFLAAYSGFLVASHFSRDGGENVALAPTRDVKPAEEPEELETVSFLEETPSRVITRNGKPLRRNKRPLRATVTPKIEEKQPPQVALDDEDMATKLASSQLENQPVVEETVASTPKAASPKPEESTKRPGLASRKNAWAMARERRSKEVFFDKLDGEKPVQRKNLAGEAIPASTPPQKAPLPEPAVKDAAYWYGLGLDSQIKGRLVEARSYYSMSLNENSGFAPSMNNKAVIDMEAGNLKVAGEGFTRAMAADPEYVDPCYNLACLNARQGKLDEALSYLRMAVDMDNTVLEWIQGDDDLATVRGMDEFEEVMNE